MERNLGLTRDGILHTAMHLMLLGVILFCLILIVPMFEVAYMQHSSSIHAVPDLTRWLVHASNDVNAWRLLLPIPIVFGSWADAVIYALIDRKFGPVKSGIWSGSVALVLTMLIGFMMYALAIWARSF